ncbi:MAG: biotin/lipoyl-binding protein [Lentisphaeraceae bacterium]|nr:biotin/lipoyl-binding protein [Lentisphaeraceae bacterium]
MKVLLLILCFFAQNIFAGHYEAISFPAQKLTLSFPASGKIDRILIQEGQLIDKGSVLVQQDNSELLLRLKRLEVELADTSEMCTVSLQLEQAQLLFDKLKLAGDAVSDTEMLQASFEIKKYRINVDACKIKKEKLLADKNILLHRIQQMKLVSPIKGLVEKKYCAIGENIERLQKVIFLVNIDTLHFDVAVDLALASKLKKGDQASIVFPDKTRQLAKLIYTTSLAEAASATRLIRLELLNKNRHPAGEKVQVIFKETK